MIRQLLDDINVRRSGVDVSERVAKMLSGERGRGAAKILMEKQAFGADPKLVNKLMAIDEKLASIGEKYRKESTAKFPEAPEMKTVEPPKPFKPGEFSREQFIRDQLEQEGRNLRRLTGWDVASVGYMLREILKGGTPWAMAYPVGKRVVASLLNNPKILDWLSRSEP
jgi:hypothetical protein